MTVQDMIKELVHMPMGAEVTAFDPHAKGFVPIRGVVWNSKTKVVRMLRANPEESE